MKTKPVITWVTPGLFDETRYLAPQANTTRDKMSPDRRRTLRQALDLAKGLHPLTGGPLHPLAAPADDRTTAGHRCGTCRFRLPGQYPKCSWPDGGGSPRITHGPATDVRAWWPACTDYESES